MEKGFLKWVRVFIEEMKVIEKARQTMYELNVLFRHILGRSGK